VVTREELEKNVWRGAIVGYDAVTNSVIKLRKALGDHAREPGIIATIPKRGYRLVAPVRYLDVEEEQLLAGPDTAGPDSVPAGKTRSRSLKAALIASALVVLVGLAAALHLIWSPATLESPALSGGESSHTPSIVVLPFDNLSDDPQFESFADGITEDIITDLSGLPALLVIASNTSFAFKGKQVPERKLAADLDVDFVLEGSIRRQGDAVRVNARLVDARSGFQKWAKRYDRQAAEVFAVQDEVTSSIVEALAVKLSQQEAERLARRTTNNLAAYDYFQVGQRLAKVSTPETNRQAQEAYRKAIELDPSYGRAYGALGYTLAFSYRRGWTDDPQQTLERALELARKGVQLADSIPQTYWALGFVHLLRKEYKLAEAAATEAVTVAPNYADGYGLLALIKNALGEPESAIALIKKGMQLNPYYTWDYPYNLGRAYYTLGRIDEAIEALEEAKTRNENAVPIRMHLAASYVRANRQDDAEWEVQEIQVLSPTDTISHLEAAHPIQDEALMNAFVDDLRTAGLPE
jgi:TolB-like protein/Tfp pilus assembly protein PilF